jgi:hypothetical protein
MGGRFVAHQMEEHDKILLIWKDALCYRTNNEHFLVELS